jgi:hypothetical protein
LSLTGVIVSGEEFFTSVSDIDKANFIGVVDAGKAPGLSNNLRIFEK